MVTMVTMPKSLGVSNRARTTVEVNCTTNDAPDATIVIPAPRTATRRSPSPAAMG